MSIVIGVLRELANLIKKRKAAKKAAKEAKEAKREPEVPAGVEVTPEATATARDIPTQDVRLRSTANST